jgi:ribonuclease-3
MKNLNILEKAIEISFREKQLLTHALTHRSYLNEHPQENLASNERLEFLGDAILEFIVSRKLFTLLPHLDEGILTTLRSLIVKTDSLAEAGDRFHLGEFLLLSKGEEETGGRANKSLLANTFEALTGAIFLDQGLAKTEEFIELSLGEKIKTIDSLENIKDYKSLFQEKAQEKKKITPTYRIINTSGPDHDKIFTVGAFLNKRKISEGKGKSKQEAEQRAAQIALESDVEN